MSNKKLYIARNKIFCNPIFLLVLIYPSLFINAQTWQPQVSGVGNSLISVFFLNELNGWAAGSYGVILHTTDGGQNWNQQVSGTNNGLNCVFFTDENTGWVCGSQGTIFKTSDGGNNWLSQNSFTIYDLMSIDFTNDSTGWVVGFGGTILKTTNGGANWNQQISPFSEVISDVDFVDSLYGWAATSASGAIESDILKTTDGGNLWELVTVATFPPGLPMSVDFIDRNIGWVVGYPEFIFQSTDGGNTWVEQQYSTPEVVLNSVSFADEHNGWTVGSEGLIDHTSNGGNLWEEQTSGTTNILWDVYFVNPTTGWIVGDNGLILKYTTSVFIEDEVSFLAPDEFVLFDNYPNPFNPSTTIQYQMPVTARVSLIIYDLPGNEVRKLLEGTQLAGAHSVVWDGKDDRGLQVASGIYFYRFKTEGFTDTKRMILMR